MTGDLRYAARSLRKTLGWWKSSTSATFPGELALILTLGACGESDGKGGCGANLTGPGCSPTPTSPVRTMVTLGSCTTVPKPRVVTVKGVASGTYQPWVGNRGPKTETVSIQISWVG